MKRSLTAASQGATQTTVTTTKVAKLQRQPRATFGKPSWAGKYRTGFPKELRMKHRYVQNGSLVGTTGTIGLQNFRCNDLYDPDASGIGHQPLYFDNVAALYNHFTVLKSKITFKGVSLLASGIPSNVVIYVNDDTTTTPGTFYERAEQSSSRYGTIIPGGNSTLVLTQKWDAKEAFGPGALSDPNLQGSSAGGPSEQQIWTVSVQAADLTSTATIYYQVTIEYDVIWQELKDISGS